jgi:hypothetical protein
VGSKKRDSTQHVKEYKRKTDTGVGEAKENYKATEGKVQM